MATKNGETVLLSDAIGAAVRKFRVRPAVNMTQGELSGKMTEIGFKWSRQTVIEIEKGSRGVSLAELLSVAHILGITVVDFLLPAFSDKKMIDISPGHDRLIATGIVDLMSMFIPPSLFVEVAEATVARGLAGEIKRLRNEEADRFYGLASQLRDAVEAIEKKADELAGDEEAS